MSHEALWHDPTTVTVFFEQYRSQRLFQWGRDAKAPSNESGTMRLTEMCNGELLSQIRNSRNLTQLELATKAGYSERLVRKAESGGTITIAAIKDMAVALSKNGSSINWEDLLCNPTQLTKQFLRAFSTFEAEMAAQVEHFIDESFVLVCAGDPSEIPFAGKWEGLEGLDKWARTFFNTFTRPDKDYFQPELIASQNTVVAWGQDLCHCPNLPSNQPFWLTLKLDFSEGKLTRYEALFDTDSGSKHLAQARAKNLIG